MNKNDAIVIILPQIDSLISFANQIYTGLKELSAHVMLMDVYTTTLEELTGFSKGRNIKVLSFNCYGLILQTTDGKFLWNELEADCYSYIVDPPVYFTSAERLPINSLTMLCVDKFHADFINNYWRKEIRAYFFPLAGTKSKKTAIPYKERPLDLIFTGACKPAAPLSDYTKNFSAPVRELWHYCYEQLLINDKNLTLEAELKKGLAFYHMEPSPEEFKKLLWDFKEIDVLIRHKYRERIIKTLIENHIKVHVFGSDYSMLNDHRENLIVHGNVPYGTSVDLTAQAKLVLNVMPWFKNGIHDRVYTAMLNHSVCVTDLSAYMEPLFTNQDVIVPFSLDLIDAIPEKINELLANPQLGEIIAQNAAGFANTHGTWAGRARVLLDIFSIHNH